MDYCVYIHITLESSGDLGIKYFWVNYQSIVLEICCKLISPKFNQLNAGTSFLELEEIMQCILTMAWA